MLPLSYHLPEHRHHLPKHRLYASTGPVVSSVWPVYRCAYVCIVFTPFQLGEGPKTPFTFTMQTVGYVLTGGTQELKRCTRGPPVPTTALDSGPCTHLPSTPL